MPHESTLDPVDILATLGISSVRAISPVHGGTDTAIWRVEHGATISALRVFRPEQAETCQREIAAMRAARQADVPVPAVHASGIWHERPVLLLSWCPGVPLWDAIRPRPWRVWPLGMAFGRTQALIHQISAHAEWQDRRTDWIGWAGPDEHQLRTALQERARPAPALLHLDYHPLNVLTDGRRITAVLDWANARAGDPRADVARTYTILMVEPYAPGRQSPVISLARRLLARGWRRGYEQVAGPLSDMDWFYVWAGAVMARDLAPRVSDPQSWWQPRHLDHIRNWTSNRKLCAERSDDSLPKQPS
jgi:aminoglycoside phosphotransferase (APT) family kinase protein